MEKFEFKVAFVIPVLNEAKLIKGCLERIRAQNYNQENIRIMIFDSGCEDETIKIANKFNVEIHLNPKKKAEYAHQIAANLCNDDIFIIFAADNYLSDKNWINQMIKPFSNSNICGSFCEIDVFKKDISSTNKYYSFLTVEPFTWFTYGKNYSIQRNFHKVFDCKNKNDLSFINYEIYKFNIENHPLIALAQGFAIKKNYFKKLTLGDDIVPFLELINSNKYFAYVKKTNIYHLHIKSILDFNGKYKSRIINNLSNNKSGIKYRGNYLSISRKLKQYIFLFYSLSLIFPIIDSIIFYINHRRAYVFLHLPCSLIITFQIFYQYLRKVFKIL